MLIFSRETGGHGYYLDFHIAETAEICIYIYIDLWTSDFHIMIIIILANIDLSQQKRDRTVQEPLEGIP